MICTCMHAQTTLFSRFVRNLFHAVSNSFGASGHSLEGGSQVFFRTRVRPERGAWTLPVLGCLLLLGTSGAVRPLAAATSPIVLPIEVLGANGTTKTVTATVPSGLDFSSVQLALQVHGLEYETQASVQVNGKAWIPLDGTDTRLEGPAAAYGGVGGGFGTLTLTVPLAANTVVSGANTIAFRFNATDGNSNGFRILRLNFRLKDGSDALAASNFRDDDPASWTAPSTTAADLTAGKALYQSAAIAQPQASGAPFSLRAHCGDCHTADGRDLKYFNYSNESIQKRALWHGLNSTQAAQIASYIRTLQAPAPAQARPWNPPYQPGPGLDAKPASEWAAGAGLSSVLASDSALRPLIAPAGTAQDFAASGYLNTRELPIAMQLPDWNHWLPRIHPLDAWGDRFAGSAYYADYKKIRGELLPGDGAMYAAARYDIEQWDADRNGFMTMWPSYGDGPWTAEQSRNVYSTGLWHLVKFWEMLQQNQLEGLGKSYFTASGADARAWPTNQAFLTSPNMLHIPAGSPGVGNGQKVTSYYTSYVWYHLQLVLNNGNGRQEGGSPIDWPYVYGFLKNLDHGSSQVPNGMLQMTWLKKALQLSAKFQGSPANNQTGWNPGTNDLSRLVHPDWQPMWVDTPAAPRASLMEAYAVNWLVAARSFPASTYYAGGWANSSESPQSGSDGSFGSKIAYTIPRLRYYGVSQGTVNALASWAQSVWPQANWNRLTTETCSPGSPNNINCPY